MLGFTGWALLTLGLSLAIGRLWVWPLSGGLLCLALFGVDPLIKLTRRGLYGSYRDSQEP